MRKGRTTTLQFRVTYEERERIEAEAKAEGFESVSELLRERVLGPESARTPGYASLAASVGVLAQSVNEVRVEQGLAPIDAAKAFIHEDEEE